MPSILPTSLLLFVFSVAAFVPVAEAQEPVSIVVPDSVQTILVNRCIDCHSADGAEAGVRFDNLSDLNQPAQLELMNRAQDQIFFGLMPPKDADSFRGKERKSVTRWLRSELRKQGASKLDEKLRQPAYGNLVDHERLFDGTVDAKPFTPARRWLVSPQIFLERVNAVFKLEGRNRQRRFYGVTNPIVLPDHSGVRYYDTTALDGGHLLVMLNNAEWISEKQIFGAVHLGQNRKNITFTNEKDRWYPTTSPEAFVDIVHQQGMPTKQQLMAAVDAQFDCVLQRPASESEMRQYLGFLKSSIIVGGNVQGLRRMLVSVLLKSEFLYRLEFGGSEVDEFDRQKLTSREAAYAIAYAITDQVPDERLLAAARTNQLQSKADYRREVRRLLNDKTSFSGEIDPTLNGIHLGSHKTSHPKVTRFFREFFGYPSSVKLFKDVARSGGFYDNAGRDYTGTAGSVSNEADRIVDDILTEDQDVFAELLTTDQFYVLHTKSNQEGQDLVAGWRQAYEGLKDTDWKENTEQALLDNFQQHRDLFAKIRIKDLREDRRKNHIRDFERFMSYFEHTFGKGQTPLTFPWFFHGGQKFRYSEIYSLPPVPGGGPLGYQGRWSRGKYEAEETWDYPVVQPFKIAHRKGILTHPAWLLAHSQNTETDPVRRGRWIREKLLAGVVPDVPITVDAQIPEDHHRTLRERLDSVTGKQECWKCHQMMNPLGLTFEIFDDFGRYRTQESLEHPDNLIKPSQGKVGSNIYKTKPVNATGTLEGTGDVMLDGKVTDALDLIDRLAKSDRVRQSIIRHVFRYFLGRNEMLSDSKTLIDADQSYLNSGGSFQAVIVSLLTSDSFIYRKHVNADPDIQHLSNAAAPPQTLLPPSHSD
ncbi:MAG: DUF1588 domain-containing protein [Fuerstiella sp.]